MRAGFRWHPHLNDSPTPVEVGLISHVFYHIPDHKWGAYTIHAANQLTEDGVLVVTLKNPDSGCNQMLEYFGAPRSTSMIA